MKRLFALILPILALLALPGLAQADLIKQSTAYSRTILMTQSADHITGATGLTLTVTVSKAGAAFASITPTVTELSNGWYKLALTSSHTDTLGALNLHVSATGADPSDSADQIVAFDPTDAAALGLTRLDAAVTSRMATFTLPTNFSTLAISGAGAVTAGTVSDKTGYSLTQAFPTNFASLAITGGGAVTAGTVSDKTGYTLSSAGYTGLLDTALSGHTTAGTVGGSLQTAGSAGDPWASLTASYNSAGTFGKLIKDYLDAAVSSRLATTAIPTNFGLLSIDGTGRVGLQSAEYTSITVGVLGAVASSYNTSGTIGAKINSAASAGDPWSTALPGSYASGTAGNILGAFTFSGGNVNSRVAAYASGQDPATLVLGAVIDGTLTVKQVQLLSQAVVSGKFAVVRNTGAKTLTVTYYKSDGVTTLAVLVTTYSDTGLTLATSRSVTFSNLP